MNKKSYMTKCPSILFLAVFILTGCKGIQVGHEPAYPKQGDTVVFTARVKKFNKTQYAKVWINGQETTINKNPQKIFFNTCKTYSQQYYQAITVKAEVKYLDGDVDTQNYSLGLTTGPAAEENPAQTYSIFVSEDFNEDQEEIHVEAAAEFVDVFTAYSKSMFAYSHPSYLDSGITQGRDLLIFIGHGYHHHFTAGTDINDQVDLSQAAYGNFRYCGGDPDVDYLVLMSCSTLSLDNWAQLPFSWYWFNTYDNRLQLRPFMGLHQVLGLKTWGGFTESCFIACSDDGDDFFHTFATFLNIGIPVRMAWLHAILGELTVDVGVNQGAVYFLADYENDSLFVEQDDYIYGSPRYNGQAYVDHIIIQ